MGIPRPPRTRLSATTESQLRDVLSLCLADSTLDNYTSGLKSFLAFCDRESVPLEARLPASEHLLCAFAASRAGGVVLSTVRNRISAVRAWHIIHCMPWQGGLHLQYVLNGVDRLAPDALPPRPPITRVMLELLHSHLDKSVSINACLLAAADIAFWGQSRLGELFPTSASKHDPKRTPSRFHLGPVSSANGSRGLHYPYTKTKRFMGDDTRLTRQLGSSCPIASSTHHLHLNRFPESLPLFSYQETPGGQWRFLTKKLFLKICNSIWHSCHIPRFTGHSFRIGGTTELLQCGVPPDIVKLMGRWSSDAFLRYWRKLEIVVPMHAQLLQPVLNPHFLSNPKPRTSRARS